MRRSLPGWLAALAVLALAGGAVVGVLKLREQADLARGQELALERLGSLTNEQPNLEWQAVAAHGAGANVLAKEVGARRRAMDPSSHACPRSASGPTRGSSSSDDPPAGARPRAAPARRGPARCGAHRRRAARRPEPEPFPGRPAPTLDDSASRAQSASFRATAATGVLVALAALFSILLLRAFQGARRSLADADERALRQSERWFRELVQNTSELIVVVKPDTTVTYVTNSALPMLGVTASDLVGRQLLELAHPEDAEGSAMRPPECRRAASSAASPRGTGLGSSSSGCGGSWRTKRAASSPAATSPTEAARERAPPPGIPRQADRAREPGAVPGPRRARAVGRRSPRRRRRGAVHRPRRFQDRERQPRPRGRATSCCGRSASGCAKACAAPTPRPGSAATSSRCCSRTSPTRRPRSRSRSGCSPRSSPFDIEGRHVP